jgi:plastocyanin
MMSMRRIMSRLHQGLAWLATLGWVAALYLIGTAAFGATSTEFHRRLGMALAVLVLLLLVVALIGGLGRLLIGLSALLVVLTVVQGLLPSLRAEAPWLAALHSVNALLLMGATAAIGRYPRAVAQGRTLVASPAASLLALTLIGGLAWLTMACGPAQPAAAKRATPEATGPAREVSVVATEMAFSPATIEVTAGQPVKLTLENDGAAPHNWQAEFGREKIPVIAQPRQAAGTSFTPRSPGTYRALCTIPGHAEAGVVGALIVK